MLINFGKLFKQILFDSTMFKIKSAEQGRETFTDFMIDLSIKMDATQI